MKFLVLICICGAALTAEAQQVTGVWKGRVGSGMRPRKVELKLVQKGDSIYGTSYYYESANNYKRYAIKGFFDHKTNGVIWWDQALVDSKSPKVKLMSPGDETWLSEADFNCPGDGRMMLDGSSRPKNDNDARIQRLHFDKVNGSQFNDEWDFVIDNYTSGGNAPEIIDSVAAIALAGKPVEKDPLVLVGAPGEPEPVAVNVPAIKTPNAGPAPVIETPKADAATTAGIASKQPTPDVVLSLPKIPEPAPPVVQTPTPPVPKPVPVAEPVAQSRPEDPPAKPANTEPIAQNKAANPPPKPMVPPPAPVTAPPVVRTPPPAPKPAPPVVRTPVPAPQPVPSPALVKTPPPAPKPSEPVVAAATPRPVEKPAPPLPVPNAAIAESFVKREKVVATEIPVMADSIELRFYDNAEVDGDSISLFLNNQLIFQHIRLTDRPYIVKLSGDQLRDGNELTMVAENLGAIPPNTSYMVAFVDNKRYDATLTSSEKSSAVIRFTRK